jgi:preprotein translocase subunit SecE
MKTIVIKFEFLMCSEVLRGKRTRARIKFLEKQLEFKFSNAVGREMTKLVWPCEKDGWV